LAEKQEKTVLRYPLEPVVPESDKESFPTETVDYVMFQRKRINYNDGGKGYKGLNTLKTNAQGLPQSDVNFKPNKTRVYLAMPKQISTAYSASYSKVDMGVAGVIASTMIGDAAGGSMTVDSAAENVQNFASAGLPQATGNVLAGITGSLNQLIGGGGNVTAADLLAVGQGRVFNPFAEQIFKEMQFRTHTFQFKLFSRSMKEAKENFNIIRYLKTGAAPIVQSVDDEAVAGIFGSKEDGGVGADETEVGNFKEAADANASVLQGARFFEVPDKYDIKFVRYNPADETLGEDGGLHFRIHTSVCTNISVNYTPDGQYSSFRTTDNGAVAVPAIALSMSFTETSLVTQKHIFGGGF